MPGFFRLGAFQQNAGDSGVHNHFTELITYWPDQPALF